MIAPKAIYCSFKLATALLRWRCNTGLLFLYKFLF